MTKEEYRAFFERQVEWNTKEIKWCEDEAKYITERLKRSRQSDRDRVEYIWGKGVVDEFEMRHYTKDYQSQETKDLLKERAHNYRWKKKAKEWLNYYSWQLTQI